MYVCRFQEAKLVRHREQEQHPSVEAIPMGEASAKVAGMREGGGAGPDLSSQQERARALIDQHLQQVRKPFLLSGDFPHMQYLVELN